MMLCPRKRKNDVGFFLWLSCVNFLMHVRVDRANFPKLLTARSFSQIWRLLPPPRVATPSFRGKRSGGEEGAELEGGVPSLQNLLTSYHTYLWLACGTYNTYVRFNNILLRLLVTKSYIHKSLVFTYSTANEGGFAG
jgi:hypothetical protein